MALKSDLQLDAALFQPNAIPKKTSEFNEQLIEIGQAGPKWWEVSP